MVPEKRAPALAVLAVGAIVLVACGGERPAAAGDVVVEMLDNSFSITEIRIPVGASVTFVGAGRNPHNAVAADGSWSTETVFGSLEMYEGDEATLTFEEPGEWVFYCTFHGNAQGQGMAGRLIVGDPSASAAAQGGGVSDAPGEWSGAIVRVPEDYPTVQAAVDAAGPGDLVLIGPGTYREAVEVTTPGLVIRGVDRNTVILDGEFQRENGVLVFADGVAVENLTARNYTANGVFWTGVRGFRGSYLTAVDNGSYGIYAFDSSDGVFEHSYASGSPDSGFYIGQCDPCESVITDVLSEWNGLGYSGTNSSGVYLLNSVWRYNHAGIVPNTLDSERLPPVARVVIAGNLVHDNNNVDAPMFDAPWSAHGNGILIAGGTDSLILRNRVVNHAVSGILIPPNLDRNFWMSYRNEVRENLVEGSGRADLALAGPAGQGNCFAGNQAATSLPVGLQAFQPCDGLRLPMLFELGGSTEQLGRVMENGMETRPDPAVGSAPKPGPQPPMPVDAPVLPAVNVFASHPVDLDAVRVPDLPSGLTVTQPKGVTVFGVLLGSATSIFFGLYAYLLPFVLYAAWVAIALWDLARSDRRRGAVIGWTAVILLVPFLGVVAYYVLGRSSLPAWKRATFVGGGLIAYLVIVVVGALVGGVV